MSIKVHIKNNHAGPDTFPSTVESEPVFTISDDKYRASAAGFADIAGNLDVFIDWDTEHFEESMKTAEVLLTWDLPTRNLATLAPRLKWIHCIGAGVEHMCPMNWLPEGVVVTNNKGAHADKAGEFALMAVLMLHNKMPAVIGNQREHIWRSLFSTPIEGNTVGIIGVGSIGGGAAKQLSKMPVTIIGVTRHGRPHDHVHKMVPIEQIDDVIGEMDYIFVATPLTPETYQLFNRERLERMKPGAGIINVGRASVLDYAALSDLLHSGHLSGAIVDVFDEEPLPAHSPLWSAPNFIVTPHISADDGDNYIAITLDLFFKNMKRYMAGDTLLNVVNPELGY